MFLSKKRLLICSLLLTLNSCNPYNSYISPPVCCPPEWKGDTVDKSPPDVDCAWWEIYDDSTLSCLEQGALANNREIEIAYFRLREASAYSRLALSQLFPQANLNPSYFKTDQLTTFTGIPGVNTVRLRQEQYQFPIEGTVNFDIWNELGLNYESAKEEAQAYCYAWQWVILGITTEVANNYYSLRTLDSELEVIAGSIAIRENQVSITSSRFEAGIVNYTDVSRAQTELTNAKAEYEDILRLRAMFENALATLTGQPAPCFELADSPLVGDVPEIPAGIPCAIIERRADIRQAERLVAAAHDQIGVAWAGFLPSVSLTGSFGYANPGLDDLFSWQSRFWTYLWNVSQVLFDGGALIANYQVAWAVYYQSVSEYYRRILVGYQEVEDALAEIEYRGYQEYELMQSVDSATTTLKLTQLLYEEGLIDYLDVVDAERTYLDAQRAEVRAYGAQFIATSRLVRALGGSWDLLPATCE